MAVQINPPNFAGLATLAGSNGNLNLQNPGALGLQGLQLSQQQQASLRDAALQKMQLRQQGEIALRQQQNQRAELAQQGNYQQGLLSQAARGQDIQMQGQRLDAAQNANQLGFQQQQLAQQGALGQGQLDLEKQKLAQDQMAKEMAKLLDEKKEKLEQKGAYAAYGLMTMQSAKTPAEAQMYKTEIIKEAVDTGLIDQKTGDALRKSPNSQFTNFLSHHVMIYDGVSKYKAMMDANKKQSAGSSPNVEFYPDGTVKSVSSTKAVETETQKSEIGLDKRLIELRNTQDLLDKNTDSLTYAGKVKLKASAEAEKLKGTPLLGTVADKTAQLLTGKDAQGRAADLDQATEFINGVEQLVMDYQHDQTGAAASMQEIERIRNQFPNGDMSPSQLKAALNQIIKKTVKESDYNKYILKQGVDVGDGSKDISSMSKEEIEAELEKLRKK